MRIFYSETKTLIVDDCHRDFATMIDEPMYRPPPSRTESFVRGSWSMLGAFAAVVLELLGLAFASAGRRARSVDRVIAQLMVGTHRPRLPEATGAHRMTATTTGPQPTATRATRYLS